MRRALVSLVTAAGLSLGLYVATGGTVSEQAVSEGRGEEKVTRAEDGGIAYLRAVRTDDGGAGFVVVDTPGCARRNRGHCVFLDGGDPGALNRYAAALLTGPGCQPVACSVFLGDDADAEEPEILRRRGPK